MHAATHQPSIQSISDPMVSNSMGMYPPGDPIIILSNTMTLIQIICNLSNWPNTLANLKLKKKYLIVSSCDKNNTVCFPNKPHKIIICKMTSHSPVLDTLKYVNP